jgi:hypothetical protein
VCLAVCHATPPSATACSLRPPRPTRVSALGSSEPPRNLAVVVLDLGSCRYLLVTVLRFRSGAKLGGAVLKTRSQNR